MLMDFSVNAIKNIQTYVDEAPGIENDLTVIKIYNIIVCKLLLSYIFNYYIVC